ncbi:MAG: hypothetical protein ABL921_28075, partial [Pirellula sp.]
MSESSKQFQSPYPRGSGTASVPVLFSLRNVQPSLVKAPSNSEPAQAVTQSNQSNTSGSSTTPTVPVAPKPVSASKIAKPGNRLYNGAIALLILILFALAIRNSQSRGTSSSPSQLATNNKKSDTSASLDSSLSSSESVRELDTPLSNAPLMLGTAAGKETSSNAPSNAASVSLLNPRPEPVQENRPFSGLATLPVSQSMLTLSGPQTEMPDRSVSNNSETITNLGIVRNTPSMNEAFAT